MPRFRPAEPEWRSWIWVGLWSFSIFATIPVARAIERGVRERLGQEAFGAFALVAIIAAAAFAAVSIARQDRSVRAAGNLAWLAAIALVFIASTVGLWANPEEAMHLVQYGLLGPLLLRALSHRFADRSIYWTAALAGALIGCVDEAIQWVTPRRYFALRDIGLNAYASGLVQLALAKGIAPAWVAPVHSAGGLRAAIRVAAAVWGMLLLFALNTPGRVAGYADRLPGLGFLADNPSTMIEYGHRYDDPSIGVFRSRLAPAALRAADVERGADTGRRVAEWRGDYSEFLARHPMRSDPYAHEFRVHLFRRDAHVTHAGRTRGAERRRHATTVVREDRILRRYFPGAFATCRCALAAARQRELESEADAAADYDSAVSEDLVTRLREPQLLAGFVLGFVALALADQRLARTPDRSG